MSVRKRGESIRRLLAIALAMAMLLSMSVLPAFGEETEAETTPTTATESTDDAPQEGDDTAAEAPEGEDAPEAEEGEADDETVDEEVDYRTYLDTYAEAKAATDKVTILAAQSGVADISKMEGAKVLTAADDPNGVLGERESALLLAEAGAVTFTFTVPETALYQVMLQYNGFSADISKESTIERRVLIDGEPTYAEAEYISLHRIFKDVYRLDENGDRVVDVNGNDIRPGQEEVFNWIDAPLCDTEGYFAEPLQFYLTAGTHTITLESVREAMVLYSITFYGREDVVSYAEVKAEYGNKGYQKADGEITFIEGESMLLKSEKSNYPLTDRSSAATRPQDPYKNLLNYIGGEKWQNSGSWAEWDVKVDTTGLYKMTLRYKQDIYSGVKISRRLTIDGELPFAEAAALTFDYNNQWETVTLGNGEEDYYFYFEAGKTYKLRMEAVLGDMGELLNRVSAVMESLNAEYRTILMITGSAPDKYRDYAFEESIPESIENMKKQAEELEAIVDEMVALTGETGERTTTLTKLSTVLRQMTDKPFVIAAKFSMFKDDLSSLGTWILESAYQPMKLDYIALVPDNQKTPKANAGFFADFLFNFKAFLSSFVIDYQAVGTTTTNDNATSKITVWVTSGRDQSGIIRNLIDTTFTPDKNIAVNLQLVTAGAVLPCVLAGRGPDVCVGVGAGDPVNYAVRDAVIGLNDFEGFDEVCDRFYDSAMVPYTFMGTSYALPETQSFSMMFVRTDIFEELGLSIPNTWDEMELLIPELQNRNMTIGLGHGLNELLTFMYQRGAPLYLNDGAATNLDSAEAVLSFAQLCDYYTLYGFPTEFDAANRFRSGEMPLLISDYGLYNQLSLFAPEIRGDWVMYQIPGTKDENGEIDRAETAGGAAVAMFRGCKDEDAAWEFMKWWTSTDTMLRYGKEMETAMNGSARQAVANVEALSQMAWSKADLDNILTQWDSVIGTPEVPGSYYTGRVQGFAFSKAVNEKVDPGDALQEYIESLNAELTRKRGEFGL